MTPLLDQIARVSGVLGWGLIHFVWQGTLLALALGAVLLVLPRRLARVRYIAGCATLAAMLAAPIWTVWRLADQGEPASPLFEVAQLTVDRAAATTQVAPAVAAPSASVAPDTPRQAIAALWLPWLVMAWSIGVLACSIRLAGGWWQAHRLARVSTRPISTEWEIRTARLAARLGLARTVRLLESTRLQVPVVVGWLRPVLLVPTAVLGGLTPQQLEAVIAHELAHIRRHDYLVNLLQSVVETLLFYHPAVWWASRTVRVEREHCCDDLAVVACGDAVLYARALTAIETLRHEGMGVAMAVSGSPLLARVRRLLGVQPQARTAASGWIVAAMTALMVSGAGVTNWMRGGPVEFAAGAEPLETPQVVATPAEASPDQAPDAPETSPADEFAVAQAERAMARAMAQQERAMEAAARAVEEAQRTSTRQARAEARHVARDAMRLAHEMMRTASQAVRDAARAMRDARREARGATWFWSSDADAPEAPEPPEPPDAPPPPPAPPAPPADAVPPAPPAPPAVPAPPAPPDAWSMSSSRDDSSWNVTNSSNGTTLKIQARGRIEFTDDDADVKSLSPGGRLVIERRVGGIGGLIGGDVKRFEARENGGTIARKYVTGGREASADEGRQWLATFLPEMLREMAVNADRRVARQIAGGGPSLVLDEISRTKSGFAKSRHLRELYKQASLDRALLTRSLQQAAREIESDFELGQALKAAAGQQAIDQAMPAFVEAARSVGSDFEQRQVLAKALARPGLTAETAGALFKAATPGRGEAGIESDFELAQLLGDAARGGHVTDTNVAAFVAAARAIGSDFERGRVVQALARAKLSDAAMAEIVGLAAGIGSDFERSRAIVGLSHNQPIGAATKKALASAAMGIGSDFERGRALSALTRAGVLGAAQ